MPDFLKGALLSPMPEFRQVTAVLTLTTATRAITVSQLHFEWEVTKTIGPDPDWATIRVYNMNAEDRRELEAAFSQAQAALNVAAGAAAAAALAPIAALGIVVEPKSFTQVGLYLGWKNRVELAYGGEVVSQRLEEWTDVDCITTLTCGDGAVTGRDTLPVGGSSFGVAADFVVASLAQQLGLNVSGAVFAVVAEKATSLPIKQFQIDYTGSPEDQLRDFLATLGLNYTKDAGELVVFDGGLRLDVAPIRLSAGTGGLLSWSPLDDGGWTIRALAEPRVVPGVPLECYDPGGLLIGAAPSRVQSVRFRGNNDGESLMEIEARPIRATGGNVGFI